MPDRLPSSRSASVSRRRNAVSPSPWLESKRTPSPGAPPASVQTSRLAVRSAATSAAFAPYPADGGVDTGTLRAQPYAGTRPRQKFRLHSTRFYLRHAYAAFRSDAHGYGHRVGMSQYGANAIARLGFDYQTILRYYYRGAKIETQKGSLV